MVFNKNMMPENRQKRAFQT